MALAEFFTKKRNALIDVVTLDASISELHAVSAQITMHPVERGANIADHVRKEPDVLQIEGIISNHPVQIGGAFTSPVDEPAQSAYEHLLSIISSGQLITIVTTLREYKDMAIQKLEVPRNAELGNVVRFTCTARQVRLVDSQVVDPPTPLQDRGEKTKNRGKQAKKPPEKKKEEKTDLIVSGLKLLGVLE